MIQCMFLESKHHSMQTAPSRPSDDLHKKEAHPEQWLSGLGGLKRLAVYMVGGLRSVLDNSRHDGVGLSPCKGQA